MRTVTRIERATTATSEFTGSGQVVFRDAGTVAISQYLSTAVGLVTAVSAARLLGPEGYGLAAMITAYPMLVWSLLDVKSTSIVTRYLSVLDLKTSEKRVASVCRLGYTIDLLSAGTASTIVAASAAFAGTEFLGAINAEWILLSYAGSLVFLSLRGTSSAILTSLGCFGRLATLQLSGRVAALGIGVGLIVSGGGVYGFVLGTAIAHIAEGVLTLYTAHRLLRRRGVRGWWLSPLEGFADFRGDLRRSLGWNYVLVTMTGLTTQLPVLVLGWTRASEEAAFYRLAMSITNASSNLGGALGRVVLPGFSREFAANGGARLWRIVKGWTLRFGIPSGVTFAAVLPGVPSILGMTFGAEYVPMARGVQAMLIGVAVSTMLFWLSPYYLAIGGLRTWTLGYGGYSLVVICGSWLIAPEFGFTGLAILVGPAKAVFSMVMAGLAGRHV